MSDSDDDNVEITPHQATVLQKEMQHGADETRRRIAALRMQVTKYDAIDYRNAQVAYQRKQVKAEREAMKEQQEELVAQKESITEQNKELATAIKDASKAFLAQRRKQLAADRTKSHKALREESTLNQEVLSAFHEEDVAWRRELHNKIVEVQTDHAAARVKATQDRQKQLKKEHSRYVEQRKAECDVATDEMANLILKEARVLRQLAKLRESHAAKKKDADGDDDEAASTTKSL